MRTITTVTVALCAVWTGCAVHSQTDERAELQRSLQGLMAAFEAHDLDRIMSRYAPGDSLVVFDVVVPRQYKGVPAYRKDFGDLLAAFPGPIHTELIEPYYEAGGEMGYSRAIVHYKMTAKDGSVIDLTARLTDVYRNSGGRWLVVHEHASWPAEFPSGRADMQSKP